MGSSLYHQTSEERTFFKHHLDNKLHQEKQTNKQTKCGVLTSSFYQSWSRKALAFSSGCVTGFYLLALKSWQWMGLKELERGSCDCSQEKLRCKGRFSLLLSMNLLWEAHLQSLTPPLPQWALLPLCLEYKTFSCLPAWPWLEWRVQDTAWTENSALPASEYIQNR